MDDAGRRDVGFSLSAHLVLLLYVRVLPWTRPGEQRKKRKGPRDERQAGRQAGGHHQENRYARANLQETRMWQIKILLIRPAGTKRGRNVWREGGRQVVAAAPAGEEGSSWPCESGGWRVEGVRVVKY